jgi:hypothetical protein
MVPPIVNLKGGQKAPKEQMCQTLFACCICHDAFSGKEVINLE